MKKVFEVPAIEVINYQTEVTMIELPEISSGVTD